MSEQEGQCNFQEPGTLKDILELLDKLKDAYGISGAVLLKLEGEVEKYFNVTEDSYGLTSSLGGVFTKAILIRKSILKNPSYETYSHISGGHTDCALKVAEALKKCLPKAYAALYYLYFMGDKTFNGNKGWESNKCDETRNIFYKWLTDDSHYGKTPGLLKRGFPEETSSLTSNTAETVADELKSAVSLNIQGDDGSLQNVLCGFMFVCSWDPALTGHACLFLSTFCSMVSQGSEDLFPVPYKDHSGAFKDVCKGLKTSLEPFIDGSSGLSAVCQRNTNLFNDLWDDGKFDKYCDWLKRNLHHIIEALQDMAQDCPDWDLSSLQSASSAGPFKYGFVFSNSSWTSGSSSKSKLQGYISKLTGEDSGSLGKFISFLFNPSTPSSAGATAGGVVTGLFGAGGLGAGAAYATNAFGFQNLVTGLISSFLK
ncbi:putative RIBOSOME BINDING PROTEIN-1 [Babesia divergens]|uniref:RIBOSOME BINDING PROTEIN-1 n=1 Tax=Babesia divergens TaxID=32595 RepID=A0AAD9GH27_BABDI|nr:putative RIBOSOME BINDING PROTEIN-1 [Babesia divergens]